MWSLPASWLNRNWILVQIVVVFHRYGIPSMLWWQTRGFSFWLIIKCFLVNITFYFEIQNRIALCKLIQIHQFSVCLLSTHCVCVCVYAWVFRITYTYIFFIVFIFLWATPVWDGHLVSFSYTCWLHCIYPKNRYSFQNWFWLSIII